MPVRKSGYNFLPKLTNIFLFVACAQLQRFVTLQDVLYNKINDNPLNPILVKIEANVVPIFVCLCPVIINLKIISPQNASISLLF